jgi:hypothetical protein
MKIDGMRESANMQDCRVSANPTISEIKSLYKKDCGEYLTVEQLDKALLNDAANRKIIYTPSDAILAAFSSAVVAGQKFTKEFKEKFDSLTR